MGSWRALGRPHNGETFDLRTEAYTGSQVRIRGQSVPGRRDRKCKVPGAGKLWLVAKQKPRMTGVWSKVGKGLETMLGDGWFILNMVRSLNLIRITDEECWSVFSK